MDFVMKYICWLVNHKGYALPDRDFVAIPRVNFSEMDNDFLSKYEYSIHIMYIRVTVQKG